MAFAPVSITIFLWQCKKHQKTEVITRKKMSVTVYIWPPEPPVLRGRWSFWKVTGLRVSVTHLLLGVGSGPEQQVSVPRWPPTEAPIPTSPDALLPAVHAVGSSCPPWLSALEQPATYQNRSSRKPLLLWVQQQGDWIRQRASSENFILK